jgi:cysteine desulfurase family protein (TIGR01976 family)
MDLSFVRSEFPSLAETDANGRPYVYLDGPGGTQAHRSVIAAMQEYFVRANANTHGEFITSQRADAAIASARSAMADFLNAPSADEIIFGQNMTTISFHLSHALERALKPGDEIVVTRLDHNANIAPWLRLEERGVVVRWVDFQTADCRLDMEMFRRQINARTRWVAVGYASNAVGTVNDVAQIVAWAHALGAWVWVDAVHYAPHGPIDVQSLGCDFLVCSAYKFFGPHVGALWGRREILERLTPDKVRPASNQIPDCFETGTQNHEGLAGVTAAVDYLASVGQRAGQDFAAQFPGFSGRRLQLKTAMAAIREYEKSLGWQLIDGLKRIRGLHIWGISDHAQAAWRVPTVSITLDGRTPQEIARRLGDEGIFVWDGNFYAITVTEGLGLEESGGLVRLGLAHYNTAAEVERLLKALARIAA